MVLDNIYIIISDLNSSDKIRNTTDSFPIVHHNVYVHRTLSCRIEHSIASDGHFNLEKKMMEK